MATKFTKKQIELADKIINDVAEDIDCGESKKDLRMAISYLASSSIKELAELGSARQILRMIHDIVAVHHYTK